MSTDTGCPIKIMLEPDGALETRTIEGRRIFILNKRNEKIGSVAVMIRGIAVSPEITSEEKEYIWEFMKLIRMGISRQIDAMENTSSSKPAAEVKP